MTTKVHPVQAIHDLSIRVSYAQLEDLIADCDAKLAAAIAQLRVKHRNGSNTAKLYVRINSLNARKSSLLAMVKWDTTPKPVDYSARIMREDMTKSERALRATR
jgi:uncharacterized protein (DUF2141 family)